LSEKPYFLNFWENEAL